MVMHSVISTEIEQFLINWQMRNHVIRTIPIQLDPNYFKGYQ